METLPVDILCCIYQHLPTKILKILITYHYPSYFVCATKSFWINYKKIELYEEVNYTTPLTWIKEYQICKELNKINNTFVCNDADLSYNVMQSIVKWDMVGKRQLTYRPYIDFSLLTITHTSDIVVYVKIKSGSFLYYFLRAHDLIKKIIYTLFKLNLIDKHRPHPNDRFDHLTLGNHISS